MNRSVLVVALLSLTSCDRDDQPITGTIFSNNHTPRELRNEYLTRDEQRQQIQATGVDDQGVDLTARKAWANEHGLKEPSE